MNDVKVNEITFNKNIILKSFKHLFSYLFSHPIHTIVFTVAIVASYMLFKFISLLYLSLCFVLFSCYISLLMAESNKTNQFFPQTISVFTRYFNKIYLSKVTIFICIFFFALISVPTIFFDEKILEDKLTLEYYSSGCSFIMLLILLSDLLFKTIKFSFDIEDKENINPNLLFILGLKGYIISCLGKTLEQENRKLINEALSKNGKVLELYNRFLMTLLLVVSLLIDALVPLIFAIPALALIPLIVGFLQREIFYAMFDTGIKEKEKEKIDLFNVQTA